MVYFGTVKNGKIIPEPGARLVEGATVRIEPLNVAHPTRVDPAQPDPADAIGTDAVETGITDLASEHDHYIYGTPKRKA